MTGSARLKSKTNPHLSTSSPTDGTSSFQYDALDRTTTVAEQDNSQVTTVYSGPYTTITDETGAKRKTYTDALGRMTTVWEDPGGNASFSWETDYQYNLLGKLTRVDQKGGDSNSANWRTRTFVYDSLSRLTSATNPESGTSTYSYDNDSNLTAKTSPVPNKIAIDHSSPQTVTITYGYDSHHRMTSKTYTDPTMASVKYGYDGFALSGCTTIPQTITGATNLIEARSAMCDASGASSWSYDSMERIGAEKRTLVSSQSITKTTTYGYDAAGFMISVTYPSMRAINYTANNLGLAASAVDNANSINYVMSATYAPPGELTGMFNGIVAGGFSGITTVNFYNSRLQPCCLSASIGAVPTQCSDIGHVGNVLDFTYDYHSGTAQDNGNIYQITNNRDATRSLLYTYDALNRIKTAATQGTTGTNCWGQMFGHMNGSTFVPGIDPWGDLNEITPTQCSALTLSQTSTPTNQISGFCYDIAGNLASPSPCPTQLPYNPTYIYDAEDRLVSIQSTQTPWYTYDGDGRRVIKTALGGNRMYWTGSGETLTESDLSGNATADYIYFGGRRVARIDLPGTTARYYFSNHLGSASVVTDNLGVIKNESDYYPYGGERAVTSGDTNRYKFTGQERDAESGLDYFIARHYANAFGRFMQADSIFSHTDDPQSLNRFRCRNSCRRAG